MIKYLCFLTMLVLANCTKSDEDLNDGFSLEGEWKLVEYCMSPGDITCPKMIPDFDQVFEFKDDKFNFSGLDSKCNGIYQLAGQTNIAFTFEGQACINQSMFLIIDNKDQIRINPPCKEACNYIYKRQ